MITTKESLEEKLTLRSDERAWFDSPSSLPLLISDYYFSLIEDTPDDPIRREVIPSSLETVEDASIDPLREVSHSVTSRLIHRYNNRAALLTTDRCFTYCRHCFRRRFTGLDTGPISEKEIDEAAAYLKYHHEIKELLLTGGDMFTLSNERLEYLFRTLKEVRSDIILRLCTRAPVTYPDRFDDEVMDIISKYSYGAPFMLLTHYNHPRELTERSLSAVKRFLDLGIPAFNQTVLLAGVNDDADVLEKLCNGLLYNRIKPYYLFQGDLVMGTAHLRTDIKDGIALEQELRRRLSGLAMPQYTLDLPEGGGKIVLTSDHFIGEDEKCYHFTTPEGEERSYPKKNS
ncbi:MAG: KamA family radical SAM protein [Bullifex sp.]